MQAGVSIPLVRGDDRKVVEPLSRTVRPSNGSISCSARSAIGRNRSRDVSLPAIRQRTDGVGHLGIAVDGSPHPFERKQPNTSMSISMRSGAGVAVGMGVGTGVGVGVEVGVAVRSGVGVYVGVGVAVRTGGTVGGSGVAVAVGTGVQVGIGVHVGSGVGATGLEQAARASSSRLQPNLAFNKGLLEL